MQLIQDAMWLHQQGRLAEAEPLYRAALKQQPKSFEALHWLGVLKLQQGRPDEAVEFIAAAVKRNPGAIETVSLLGSVLASLNRFKEALPHLDAVLRIRSDDFHARYNRAVALGGLGRVDAALADYDQILAVRGADPVVLFNRGNLLAQLRRFDEALASYDRSVAAAPREAAFWLNRAHVLMKLHRFEDALKSYDQVLALLPSDVAASPGGGQPVRELGATIAPRTAADPVEALDGSGLALFQLGRASEAAERFRRLLKLNPNHPRALGRLAFCALTDCDWDEVSALKPRLQTGVASGAAIVEPMAFLLMGSEPAEHLRGVRGYVNDMVVPIAKPAWIRKPRSGNRLRIAYLSSDFRAHPIAVLTAELFECHDRSRFETVAISYGPDDGSELRARLMRAFDQFHDVRGKGDDAAARLINELGVDIAVDLNNHTLLCRPHILAQRPAPVQVALLGIPSTMGVDFIDYFIADPFVLPFDQQPYYTEKIVHLPESYLMQDATRVVASPPARREAGLPETGFVFCAFNNNFKFSAPVFDIWMRLLGRFGGSVLWLSRPNEAATANLRRAAQARGVDPDRIVFAPRLKRMEDHLGRHQLADLFLDTLPYNAHTTAGDALWAGLPVLTCAGNSWAGRVAGTLLKAVGLPELITHSLSDYEAMAMRLVEQPELLALLRQRLAQNRLSYPLFDTARYCRHLEAAYTTMWDIHGRGESPRGFSVEPVS